MVARILGKLLHMIGILPTDKVTEVQRTDLVGEFVGHTGPKTRRKIKDAEGGILFVDEAYRLIPTQKSDDKDYGLEALEEIMSVMDSGKVVVIFAGLHRSCTRGAVGELIARETTEEWLKQMNGGLVDTLLVNARENLDLRLDFSCNDAETMITITLEDLEAGLRQISRQRHLW
ncbi:unnamed protein product [Triticum turgidum subsp. durum]|uniref:ATPase AAA-type core domain-containing protein n=1 Tax=Triticum turgidum subsp. durum TaxID=4567 RepID=A0A9R0Y0M5_TRITD|nr:unnamed protein product [Triticum turgidum subsp. durum]